MKLYNSLTRTIEEFVPKGEVVTIYVCGITPYDTTHLGHAFTYTVADVLVRFLEIQGKKVRYVQNVTDIDDDVLRKARAVREDWQVLGNRWTTKFIRDMKQLNVRAPDHFPRATEFIPEIIGMVQNLIDKGFAYTKAGNVYYDFSSWPEFGRMSQLSKDEMLHIANERGNNPDDPNKHHPLDFVLWQAQVPDEPGWISPWGKGRPGWHIECSTMINQLLGETIDIHSGGADLCFPHHECEIAQVEPITNKTPFVHFWMHVAMVMHAGEKMSKSLGNLVMLDELLKTHSANAVRVYLGSHHYRTSWSYNEGLLHQAEELVSLMQRAMTVKSGKGISPGYESAWQEFTSALDDDLNTPAALLVMKKLSTSILEDAQRNIDISEGQRLLRKMGRVFGLLLGTDEPDHSSISGWNKYIQKFL